MARRPDGRVERTDAGRAGKVVLDGGYLFMRSSRFLAEYATYHGWLQVLVFLLYAVQICLGESYKSSAAAAADKCYIFLPSAKGPFDFSVPPHFRVCGGRSYATGLNGSRSSLGWRLLGQGCALSRDFSVSRRTNVSVSAIYVSCARRYFRPNYASHVDKMSQISSRYLWQC